MSKNKTNVSSFLDLTELANLSIVTNQLKTVINTAGHARFTRDTLMALKKRLAQLEEQFIQTMILDVDKIDLTENKKNLQQAKQELMVPNKVVAAGILDPVVKNGYVTIQPMEPPAEPLQEKTSETEKVYIDPIMTKDTTEITTAQDDEELRNRLVEEKKKLGSKRKRKAVPVTPVQE